MKPDRTDSSKSWRLGAPLALLVAAASSCTVAVADQNLLIPCADFSYSYAAKASETIVPTDIQTNRNAFWVFEPSGGNLACSGNGPYNCIGLTVTPPPPDELIDHTSPTGRTTITGTSSPDSPDNADQFSIRVTDEDGGTCRGTYDFRITANGGGWGDPHLTTVDGVHYDFQSAGEFTALREDKFEVQTRQSAVPTATVPITNAYTGITHCVSVFTAVAARLGSSRVTLQPNPDVEASSRGMELRVNGKLVTLTDAGIVVTAGGQEPSVAAKQGAIDGHIKKAAGGAIEIIDARGTQLVVTPKFWNGPKVWYLNVNVYQTSANQGTMGAIAEGSWLPALPDGSSLGPRPETEDQRYEDLYEKFADAWRVTDTSSLFDYASGTSTATFTLDEWPRLHPQSCGIEGQTSQQPAAEAVAQQACAAVTDPVQKADCVFDVMVTGHTGFGESYEVMQDFKPRGTGTWYSPNPPVAEPPGTPDWKDLVKKWWWLILLVLLLLIIVRLLFGKKSP